MDPVRKLKERRNRVHSAPPTDERLPTGIILPPITRQSTLKNNLPTTPDKSSIQKILEQRMVVALKGPTRLLKQNSSFDSFDLGRRKTLQRALASASNDDDFVRMEPGEMSMLKSINKKEAPQSSMGGLSKHEFNDESDEEAGELRRRRKLSMVRQQTLDDEDAPLTSVRLKKLSDAKSHLNELEDKLAGYRHEKLGNSIRSTDLADDQINGLVYDVDFDCYYDPQTDTYYRLKSHL